MLVHAIYDHALVEIVVHKNFKGVLMLAYKFTSQRKGFEHSSTLNTMTDEYLTGVLW